MHEIWAKHAIVSTRQKGKVDALPGTEWFRPDIRTDLEPIVQIGRKGDVPGTFAQPKGIAIDPEGHLYVVDAHFEAVQVFDPEGTLLLTFGREGRGPGEFWLPGGIHIDGSGRIWIADSYNRRVQVGR